MVPVDPLNPAAGYEFRSPDEFVVVGPTESFQTNRTETDHINATVTGILDADALPAPAGPNTTRYYLVVNTPPLLTSFPVSLLGRQIVFADDTLTVANQGAARIITNYGGNFVVVDRNNPEVDNGGVAQLTPQVGTLQALRRQAGFGGRVQRGLRPPTSSSLPTPDFVPSPAQARLDEGNVDVNWPAAGAARHRLGRAGAHRHQPPDPRPVRGGPPPHQRVRLRS
jgi:hypothetical protein